MNKFIKTSCAILTTAILASCGSSEGGYTDGDNGGSNSGGTAITNGTNVASNKHLAILFSDTSPEVWDADGAAQPQVTITVYGQVADRNGLPVTNGQTLYFDADWGTFPDGKTCNADSTGQCSVRWQSGNPLEAGDDHYVYFMLYTLGEEEFTDINSNGVFDDIDDFDLTTNDLYEPIIDCNHNLIADGVDSFVDFNSNNIFDINDGLWNGENCQHSTLCNTTTTRVPIWTFAYIDASAEDPNPALTVSACSN